WQVYFGDERCLPSDHADRNSRAAALAWLDRVPIPAANIHPIPAELGAEAGAAAYEPLVGTAMPFDLVILGMGEDGHTASLFPGQIHQVPDLVLPVHGAPKPPPDRVSLSAGALSNALEILILVTGAGKRRAVAAWKAGEPLPVASVGGSTGVDVLIDQDAYPG
ncbi:MAG: 6-phosphogluconolactonase, partial [Chromatiaceae bacterium]|nr:6-phosphogluconolactonase [Chromatiaceae bacterium]